MKKQIVTFLLLISFFSLSAQTATKRVLIAYFSMPENVALEGVDANGGASVMLKNGVVLGNTQFMAQEIKKAIGGDLFEIKTIQQYPVDHKPLVDQVQAEKTRKARPPLSTKIANVKDYDVIFLGYPNWWGDLPMPLYTFLGDYDFTGITIIPFCPHGGSGFSNTIQTIARLQPKAAVLQDGLTISRNVVARSENEIKTWATKIFNGLR